MSPEEKELIDLRNQESCINFPTPLEVAKRRMTAMGYSLVQVEEMKIDENSLIVRSSREMIARAHSKAILLDRLIDLKPTNPQLISYLIEDSLKELISLIIEMNVPIPPITQVYFQSI